MTAVAAVLGTTLGKIFQPLTQALAWLIAFFYALVPNYALAIALLTLVVMIVTAPLTVKSTRSMVAMQRVAPEMKKLQQKYKGDRQKLNEEMMNLYKEHGVNPAGGCLPLIIQMPVFFLLYGVIRGLTNTVKQHGIIASQTAALHHTVRCAATVCADPRYISTNTRLYQDLYHASGKMPAFGIDLAQKVFGHHTFVAALPYIIIVVLAIGLQYLQMRQLNSRNPAAAQANPQAQMMQRYMPLIFAFIYVNISAGVNVYFIVSTLCRIGIQEAIFHSGVLDKAKAQENKLPGSGARPKRKTIMERLADAQRQAIEAQQARQAALQSGVPDRPEGGGKPPEAGTAPPTEGGRPEGPDGRPSSGAGGNGQGRPAGNARKEPTGNGARRGSGGQSRARGKRTRKGR